MANRGLIAQPQYSTQGQRRISVPAGQAHSSSSSTASPMMHQYNTKSYSKSVTNTPVGGKHLQYSDSVIGSATKGGKLKMVAPSTSTATAGTSKSRRKVVKVNKGLRHFSMKVCEKVKEKGTTTYNEVADELVEDEMARVEASGDRSFDQKNIRRRVYDALNVLMAMNIIAKEKKEIHWLGLPTNTPAQCENLDEEISAKRQAIQAKEKELKDLLLLQVSLKNLVNRNRESEEQGYIPTPNSHIQLPFIVVNTHRDTRIHCTISQDKTEYFFKFDDKFELNDHVTLLQRMGLLMGLDNGTSTEQEIEKLKQLVAPEFQGLIEDYGRGKTTVDVPIAEFAGPMGEGEEEEVVKEDEEEDDDTMIEYVEVSSLHDPSTSSSSASSTSMQHQYHHQHHQQQQQHIQEDIEEYSEEDTIIEESY